MISVIVPVYNTEKYLSRCLSSIINQTYNDLEIIVVDDGSKGNCKEICDGFNNKLIKYFHKENGGLSSARNFGINKANGKYISFIDSDDYIEPDFYQLLYKSITDNNSEISVCRVKRHDKNGKFHAYPHFKYSENEIFTGLDYIKHTGSVGVMNKLYLADFVKNFEFINVRHEDIVFTAEIMSNCKKISYVNKCLYHYIKNEGSITDNMYDIRYIERNKACQFALERCNKDYIDIVSLIPARVLASHIDREDFGETVKSTLFKLRHYFNNDYIRKDIKTFNKIKPYIIDDLLERTLAENFALKNQNLILKNDNKKYKEIIKSFI